MNYNNAFGNNTAEVSGEVLTEFTFSHKIYGESFYTVSLKVDRLSRNCDQVPLMISERLIEVSQSYVGRYFSVKGQFRSHNQAASGGDQKSHLLLAFFVREREISDEPFDQERNQIYLDGYLCKKPVHRKTPLGREIADVLLAVNRAYGKADYIPCICWGRNARYVSMQPIGSRVRFWGRMQSRNYRKITDDGQMEVKTAYEVSVSRYELVEESDALIGRVADSGAPVWQRSQRA